MSRNIASVFFLTILGFCWIAQASYDVSLFLVPILTTPESDDEKKFVQEVECSRVGGICLDRESCIPDKISQEGTCPRQGEQGAVCCHSLSIKETRCEHLGGHCRPSCPHLMVIDRANNCGPGLFCCPLIF